MNDRDAEADARVRALTDVDRAYLAGIIDGEGNVYMQFDQRRGRTLALRITLTVSNTEEAVLRWIAGRVGGRVRQQRLRVGHRRPLWVWAADRRLATRVLRATRPYMIVRAQQADIVLAVDGLIGRGGGHLTEANLDERVAHIDRLRTLNGNQKGQYRGRRLPRRAS